MCQHCPKHWLSCGSELLFGTTCRWLRFASISIASQQPLCISQSILPVILPASQQYLGCISTATENVSYSHRRRSWLLSRVTFARPSPFLLEQHLNCLSPASRLHLDCLSIASRQHLDCVSTASRTASQRHLDFVSRQHFASISPASRLHLDSNCNVSLAKTV